MAQATNNPLALIPSMSVLVIDSSSDSLHDRHCLDDSAHSIQIEWKLKYIKIELFEHTRLRQIDIRRNLEA